LLPQGFEVITGVSLVVVGILKASREDLDASWIHNLWRCFCGEFGLLLVQISRLPYKRDY